MIRVAFTLIGGRNWIGGYNYLVNLLSAISRFQSNRVRPVLFCGKDADDSDLKPFLAMVGVDVVRSLAFNADRLTSRLIKAMLWGVDRDAVRLFRESNIDVVFECATFYGWRCPIPAVAWLPDFQHRRLREQFGMKSFWRRELGYRAQVATGRLIMLSSEDARRDCEQFYPSVKACTSVVRFAMPLHFSLLEEQPELAAEKYQLPEMFFYLPNQFWKHKNHILVIEALGLLKQRGREIVIAATGSPDLRHPEILEALNRRIESLSLQRHFRILGMIPREHVISLMRTCTALINPSLFEGWSSTVEEARALSVPMLLSDIAVHREQMGKDANYFDPADAGDLAEKLWKTHVDSEPLLSARTPNMQGDENVRRFAYDFVSVLDQVKWRR